MKNSKLIIIIFAFSLSLNKVNAMQTIFNVPSADVTEKDRIYLEQEGQFRAWNPDAFFWGTSYINYGIGHNTELDATLMNVGSPATRNISLGVGFKSAMPIPGLKEKFPEREFKLTVGSQMLFGLEGNGVGNWSYAHVSGRLPKTRTRLAAGISSGSRQAFEYDTTSFIATVEQPVTKKLTLLGDWFSGNGHWAQYLIVGASYALPKNTTIFAGYQIPNDPNTGISGFVIELGKLF